MDLITVKVLDKINFEVDTQGDIQNIYIDTSLIMKNFVKMII